MKTQRKRRNWTENQIQRVSEIEDAEEARYTAAAETTPAGPVRMKVDKVTKRSGKVLRGAAPVAKPSMRSALNSQSHSGGVVNSDDISLPPSDGDEEPTIPNPKLKIRNAIQVIKAQGKTSSNKGQQKNHEGTKRAHTYDTTVGLSFRTEFEVLIRQ